MLPSKTKMRALLSGTATDVHLLKIVSQNLLQQLIGFPIVDEVITRPSVGMAGGILFFTCIILVFNDRQASIHNHLV